MNSIVCIVADDDWVEFFSNQNQCECDSSCLERSHDGELCSSVLNTVCVNDYFVVNL